jgi:predicted ATPase
MKKNPDLIRSIDVKYYRSINNAQLKYCSRFNIVTGANDAGKSNILRALNLFFNEVNHEGEEIDFSAEFSQRRLEQVRKESVKGKQFIQISIEFNRGEFFQQTLPERFRVTKTWYRDRLAPEQTDDLGAKSKAGKIESTLNKAKTSLTKYLNRIEFNYIPAIKDEDTFANILEAFQRIIFDESEKSGAFTAPVAEFNKELEAQGAAFRADFLKSSGINARVMLPSSHADLFQAVRVNTDGIAGEDIPLDQRGDGIRVRFIPAVLNYVCRRSQKFHIWGFEEPENSMEFRRAFELCEAMRNSYSENAQIFITTHSPAFIDFTKTNQTIYVCRRKGGDTIYDAVTPNTEPSLFEVGPELGIAQELGHVALLGKLHDQLLDALGQAQAIKDTTQKLESQLDDMRRPVVLTEGSTDVSIVSEAWARLRPNKPCPFAVIPCDTLPNTDPNEAGGASVLAGALKSVRPDFHSLTIGLFDRDDEGVKQFALDKNFQPHRMLPDVKVHKNKKAIAMLLPYLSDRSDFAEDLNLPIEFIFDVQFLEKEIDGRKLLISFKAKNVMVGGKVLSSALSTEPRHMILKGNKPWFADRVVPTLPDSAFDGFEPLISAIESLIGEFSK